MFQCWKLLVAYVPKYNWGIQKICNILLQASKGKKDRAISGVVEGECIEFIREPPSSDPLM